MIFLPSDEMFPNKFVETIVPTKGQIFARTGQHAVSPAGSYTGDEGVKHKKTKTESASEFVAAAESYTVPKNED